MRDELRRTANPLSERPGLLQGSPRAGQKSRYREFDSPSSHYARAEEKRERAENDVFWTSSLFPQADHPGSPIFYAAVHLFIRSESIMTHMSEDMLSRQVSSVPTWTWKRRRVS
jgi:hypothetical protein